MTHTTRLAVLKTHNWHAITSFRVRPITIDDGTTHECVWIEGPIHRAECTAYLLIESGIVLLHGAGKQETFDEFVATLTQKPGTVPPPVVQQERQRSLFD